MVAIGAAFDFAAGTQREAPTIFQSLGSEWLFRLAMEPRRLASRYARSAALVPELVRSARAWRVGTLRTRKDSPVNSQVADGMRARLLRIPGWDALHRLGGGVVSQVLSSATNFLLSVLVLREAGLAAFGWFTLVFFAYLLGINLVRAIVGTPMLLSEQGRAARAGGFGVAVLLGVAMATLGLPLVLLMPADQRHFGLAMALALPFALLQDSQRFSAFADKTPGRAAVLDGVWLLVMVVPALVAAIDPTTAWAVGAAISALIGVYGQRLRPARRLVVAFLRATRTWRNGLLSEAAGAMAVLQAGPYLVALVVGVGAFGALRAAYTLVAPVSMVVAGVAPILLVSYQQLTRDRPGALRRRAALCATVIAAAGFAYVGVVLMLPAAILESAFGPEVLDVLVLVVPIAIAMISFAVLCNILDALRGLCPPRTIAFVRVSAGFLELGGFLIGGITAGVSGAAWGGAGGMLVTLALAVGLMLWTPVTTAALESVAEASSATNQDRR